MVPPQFSQKPRSTPTPSRPRAPQLPHAARVSATSSSSSASSSATPLSQSPAPSSGNANVRKSSVDIEYLCAPLFFMMDDPARNLCSRDTFMARPLARAERKAFEISIDTVSHANRDDALTALREFIRPGASRITPVSRPVPVAPSIEENLVDPVAVDRPLSPHLFGDVGGGDVQIGGMILPLAPSPGAVDERDTEFKTQAGDLAYALYQMLLAGPVVPVDQTSFPTQRLLDQLISAYTYFASFLVSPPYAPDQKTKATFVRKVNEIMGMKRTDDPDDILVVFRMLVLIKIQECMPETIILK